MPKVIETLFDKSSVIYEVQTTFPGSGPSRYGKFGSYYASAYCHKDTPRKYILWTHPGMLPGVKPGGSCKFDNYEDAKKCADFLVAECRLYCGWDGNEVWHIARREPLEARVVIRSSRETVHVLD